MTGREPDGQWHTPLPAEHSGGARAGQGCPGPQLGCLRRITWQRWPLVPPPSIFLVSLCLPFLADVYRALAPSPLSFTIQLQIIAPVAVGVYASSMRPSYSQDETSALKMRMVPGCCLLVSSAELLVHC